MVRERKSLFSKAVSLALAAVMMVSVIGILPERVSAATEIKLNPSGTTNVAITDEQCSAVVQDYAWLTIKPKADGYLQLKFLSGSVAAPYSVGRVMLYNAAKNKVLSSEMSYNTNLTDSSYTTECYGLKKGATYSIRLNTANGVKIAATFKKVSDKSGKKASKARNIAKKKVATGLFLAGKSETDCYKFKLTKNQKIKFNFTPYLTGTAYLTLSGPGVYTRTFTIGTGSWGKKYPVVTTGSVRAGTYHVKLKPASKTTTGYYKVTWK